MKKMNLVSLMDRYDSDEKCVDLLAKLRWPSGVACVRCGDMAVDRVTRGRGLWMCRSCDHQFSVTAGTIMHRSRLPLRKWFIAIYLMCQSKKGMSAHQLHRMLGTTYRTAWHLAHRIREAMGNDPFTEPTLVGVVEVDETMIGGKSSGKNWRDNKHWVAGAIERGGRVRIERIPDSRKGTIHDFVKRNISPEAEAIYTDELRSHIGLDTDTRRHESVNHAAEEWVVGDVHTNSVEGVWSLFKRSIVGAFHKMSVKHMDRYLEEMEWRFNNRDNPNIFMDTLRRIVNTDPLQYRDLVA
ncbi:MAG: IS1595 family transposase [Gemmatimonadetes bacterium]|nr:IS1595 family transposase [Gemmatimonadota bacterium]